MIKHIAMAAALALTGATASAAVNVTYTNGAAYNASALTNYSTSGYDMAGMDVTVLFANGTSSSAVWKAGPANSSTGSATGTGWSLSLSGDSISSPWVLSNTGSSVGILGFTLDGTNGKTSFDRGYGLNGGSNYSDKSNNSSSGQEFFFDSGSFSGTATTITGANAAYSKGLAVGGTFKGDEWLKLSVMFTGGTLTKGASLNFIADTDNTTLLPSPVPEPGTYAMMAVGLAAIGFVARRRRAA